MNKNVFKQQHVAPHVRGSNFSVSFCTSHRVPSVDFAHIVLSPLVFARSRRAFFSPQEPRCPQCSFFFSIFPVYIEGAFLPTAAPRQFHKFIVPTLRSTPMIDLAFTAFHDFSLSVIIPTTTNVCGVAVTRVSLSFNYTSCEERTSTATTTLRTIEKKRYLAYPMQIPTDCFCGCVVYSTRASANISKALLLPKRCCGIGPKRANHSWHFVWPLESVVS